MGSVSLRFNPMPPRAGQECSVETTGLIPGTELKLDWDPPCEPASGIIDDAGKVTFIVPDAALTLIVSDPESGAEAASAVFH
jgi:hypothetical protein